MATEGEELLDGFYISDISEMITVTGTALIIYEQALTIGEVSRIICQRRAISSILLGLNQLFLILFSVFNLLDMPSWTTAMSCEAVDLCWNILLTALVMISTMITALRVHVVSGGNRRLVAPTFILGIASIFIYIGILFHDASYYIARLPTSPSVSACFYSFDSTGAGFHAAIIVPFICTFLSDVIVILVTWSRMRDYGDSSGLFLRTSPLKSRLARLFLVDGTIYFL